MQTTHEDLILLGREGGGNETPLLRLVFFVQTKQSQAYDINMLSSPPPPFKYLNRLDFQVLQTERHWRTPQAVTFNFHENYLQTVRHWKTPQAVIFNSPTNGTPVEGAPKPLHSIFTKISYKRHATGGRPKLYYSIVYKQ
jgi:hypothetical protein